MNNLKRNLTLLTDFYQITMGNGYLKNKMKDKIAHFDMFFRKIPDNGGFVIFAGLEQLINYLNDLKFSKEDIDFLRKKNMFDEQFLQYLQEFEFKCDIWSVPEGTPVFPYEPIIKVKGPIIQAQLIETMLLLTVNHQSLIATKVNRMIRASHGRDVIEFGSRRAQGYDGAILGARASYIGGCAGTACTLAEAEYGIPCTGTMAHSWVQSFDTEYEAFKSYAENYPNSCILLVDTYDVINSGIPNAIRVAKEVLEPQGKRLKGIRLDSGDIAYLSKKVRKILDKKGLTDCKIIASNSLDEYIITDLIAQGAKVDVFGVGENLITSKSSPVFGGVYKLTAIQDGLGVKSKIKISENVEKITNPGIKQLYRFYNKKTNKAIADLITIDGENIKNNKVYNLFDPVNTWKSINVNMDDCIIKELHVKIFDNGKCIYKSPSINTIRNYCKNQINTLWDELLRFENPHKYYVDLSEKLWIKKKYMINEYRNDK